LNLPASFLDESSGNSDEGAMTKIQTICSLTALVAATALSGGAAHAQQPFLLFQAPAYHQQAPQQAYAQPYAQPQYEAVPQAEETEAAAPLDPRLQRQVVDYRGNEAPGTVIVDTPNTFLYYVLGDGKAIRYGIGVGREGFTWSGVKSVERKTEWPDWYPPAEMLQRQPYLPRMMAGGAGNPLGARAMYIAGTQYRIHGTNNPGSIGKRMSSGCIRMTNENAIDLYNRVKIGAKVVVLPMAGGPAIAKAKTNWRARAEAAIERSRNAEPRRARVTSVGRPAGIY
jgi:lipoprotein-anchoring transpeptidase ErfK/SrfK